MKNQRQYKIRFFYTPGLISLIFLPILCLWQINRYSPPPKEKAMQIVLWDKNEYNHFPELKKFHKPLPKRNYVTINLTGNTMIDVVKLNLGQLAIRQLLNPVDTVNGIDFRFTNHSQYWSFIKALDICKIENAKSYWYVNDDILVFNYKPLTKIELAEYDSAINRIPPPLCGGVFYDAPPKSKEQIEQEKQAHFDFIINTIKVFWLPEILFLVMIILSVIKFRRFFAGVDSAQSFFHLICDSDISLQTNKSSI